MKIAIIGAGGNIGQRLTQEVINRGHQATLISSKDKSFFGAEDNDNVEVIKSDIFDTEALTAAIKGNDVVISAYNPPYTDTDQLISASQSLISAAKSTGTRVIAVGGAGSLYVSESQQLVDSPDFPEEYRAMATSHKTVLETVYQTETDVEWTNVSPAAYIFEGERTNNFRVGQDHILLDAEGQSSVSMEDFAVGVLNEVDNKAYINKRFTIGY